MDDQFEDPRSPMDHPQEQPAGTDDVPKFGRLMVVLVIAVILVGLITFASEAYFSR